jgi:glucose-1-phosphate thymidylyltransferase
MKIIIPMAGMGKRMRPHTLTVPKPLIPIAGKPIVQRLVEDIVKVCGESVDEIAFVIGRFGPEVEQKLLAIAAAEGAKGSIFYQDEPLGTAHAILCAQAALVGEVVVAFADTLFKADFKLDTNPENTIWVQQVEDPRPFGVVKLNEQGQITDFVEKPEQFVSDLAIIGIYYFRDGAYLRSELQYLIDNNIKEKGEFQLTNALENMKQKGTTFVPGRVTEWLDCGNKNSTVFTNARYLEFLRERQGEAALVDASAHITNSIILHPVYIGPGVRVVDSIVGPHVSLGQGTVISDSIIKNCIVQENAKIKHANLHNSMVGSHASVEGHPSDLSIGDYNQIIA